MIRQANKFDKEMITQMMREFRDSCEFPEIAQADNINSLLDSIIAGAGVAFVSDNKGVFLAIKIPSIWDSSIYALHEIAWYVRPEYRNTTIGFRLFDAYLKYAKGMKDQGHIQYFTMTKLDVSPNIKYEKYGFRKKDENWIQ